MANQPSPQDATKTYKATLLARKPEEELPRAKGASAPADPPASRTSKPATEHVGVRGELEELKQHGALWLVLRSWLRASPAWLTSMVLHIVVLLLLALILVPSAPARVLNELIANAIDENAEEIEEITDEKVEDIDLSQTEIVQAVPTESMTDQIEEAANNLDTSAVAVPVELTDFSQVHAIKSDLLKTIGATAGKDLDGRGNPAAKKQMIAQGGGNAKSEEAVALALEWLANQQLQDGGWSFDSPNSGGTLKTGRNGATGMALLPFLGAGQTHREGKYKRNVEAGLYFLGKQMKQDGSLLDGGRMYSHGICAIVLGEAYAMTQDKALYPHAQGAMNFIMSAQDKIGGGWRYAPGEPGDTSAVGWQIMALKSGHMGYLAIDPRTIAGANNFLNTVQSNSGANYGYTGPGKGAGTTAVGLLCRMYLGWKKDHPGIEQGTDFLSKAGPSKGNMYYNYYATQVMHHFEGEKWKKWNEVMRDQLVNTQEKAGGPLRGSWLTKGDHGSDVGGRIYCTSMCCMTLEVYYRHMPIYRKQAAEDEFEGL